MESLDKDLSLIFLKKITVNEQYIFVEYKSDL